MLGIRSNRLSSVQPIEEPVGTMEITPSLHRLVVELGQLLGAHVRATDAAMQLLEDRITDLEGHAEHGPAGRCGVCDDGEPETVSAPVYVLGRIMNADTEESGE